MIVPVYFDAVSRISIQINEKIHLVNEKGAYSAYNFLMEKVGDLSKRTTCNKSYPKYFFNTIVNGRVWAIFSNKILVEITKA